MRAHEFINEDLGSAFNNAKSYLQNKKDQIKSTVNSISDKVANSKFGQSRVGQGLGNIGSATGREIGNVARGVGSDISSGVKKAAWAGANQALGGGLGYLASHTSWGKNAQNIQAQQNFRNSFGKTILTQIKNSQISGQPFNPEDFLNRYTKAYHWVVNPNQTAEVSKFLTSPEMMNNNGLNNRKNLYGLADLMFKIGASQTRDMNNKVISAPTTQPKQQYVPFNKRRT